MGLAEAGLIEIRWSEQILAEVENALTKKLGHSPDRVARRIGSMRRAFPLAAVHGWEARATEVRCHPKDAHVLAAAVEARADVLLTRNLKDFPDGATEPYDVTVMDPDTFLLEVLAVAADKVREVVRAEAMHRSRPAMSARDLLASLTLEAPTAANTIALSLDDAASADPDLPGSTWATDRPPEVVEFEREAVLTDPLHVAWAFAQALTRRPGRPRLQGPRLLVSSPGPWGDFIWAAELLDQMSWTTGVYQAVDRPEELAFVRFTSIPGNVQATHSHLVRASWVFATMVRLPDETWRVWGRGARMVSWQEVNG